MTLRIATAAAGGIGLIFALACGGSTVDTSVWAPSGGGGGIGTAPSGGTATCPADASYEPQFADGTRMQLLAINTDDAYAGGEHEAKLPLSGRVDGDLHNNGGCWFGGGFVGDDGTDFYFYKAAFKPE